MKTSNISFPHPVLGISDDIRGSFKADPTIHYNRNKTNITINWYLACPSLQEMIVKKQAIFCVEINCPDTIFRENYLSSDSNQEIEISTQELRNTVHLNFYILASADLQFYAINEFNEDYRGHSFDIQKGDVLAVGGSSVFPAEKSWEALRSVSSFMVVDSYSDKNGPVKYDFGGEKIRILLPKEDYRNYEKYCEADNLPAIFHSSLVFPVLIHALTIVLAETDNPESYGDKKWYQVLKIRLDSSEFKEKLKNKNISLENVMEIAQTILDNPVHRTLKGIDLFLQQANKNDDY